MRYTRNLEALLFGQKLNTYQRSLAIQEYEYLKTELSKYQQSDIKQCTCIGEHKTYEYNLNECRICEKPIK